MVSIVYSNLSKNYSGEKKLIKVAMCVSEAVPFAKTGGLADVAGALP